MGPYPNPHSVRSPCGNAPPQRAGSGIPAKASSQWALSYRTTWHPGQPGIWRFLSIHTMLWIFCAKSKSTFILITGTPQSPGIAQEAGWWKLCANWHPCKCCSSMSFSDWNSRFSGYKHSKTAPNTHVSVWKSSCKRPRSQLVATESGCLCDSCVWHQRNDTKGLMARQWTGLRCVGMCRHRNSSAHCRLIWSLL